MRTDVDRQDIIRQRTIESVDRLVTGSFSHSRLDPLLHCLQEFWWSPALTSRLAVAGGMAVRQTTYSQGLRVSGQVLSTP